MKDDENFGINVYNSIRYLSVLLLIHYNMDYLLNFVKYILIDRNVTRVFVRVLSTNDENIF